MRKKERARQVLVHINKNEIRKGVDGKPYTLHLSDRCIPAKQVDFLTKNCKTDFRPHLPSNPKVFIN